MSLVEGGPFVWAPWVLKIGNVLLGPQLKALRVPHLDISLIPQEKLEYLLNNHYLVAQSAPEASQAYTDASTVLDKGLGAQPSTRTADQPLHWIWISEPSLLAAALLLKEHLSSCEPNNPWAVVMDKGIILEHLAAITVSNSSKPLIIRLSHQEPIGEAIAQNIYADLLGRTQIVWIGESSDGTHLGPIMRSADDLTQYLYATNIWHFSRKLIQFGFADYWPLAISKHLLSKPRQIAEGIVAILKAPAGTCIILEESRTVRLWTCLIEEKVSESDFFERQFFHARALA